MQELERLNEALRRRGALATQATPAASNSSVGFFFVARFSKLTFVVAVGQHVGMHSN